MITIAKFKTHLLIAAATLSVVTINARERQGVTFKSANTNRIMAACNPAQSAAELNVNNVRTIIYSGSDMWWDLFGSGNARYAVPKVTDWAQAQNSNFAGNVWFGGYDAGNNLKVAAQTYRQFGVDFWTGPLSMVDASTDISSCNSYDKIYKITRKEVDEFVLAAGPITDAIKNWPGNGDITLNHDPQMAPFVDIDNDNIYNPAAGDYPFYDVYSSGAKLPDGTCKARVFGDETLWWVYNDNGNLHQATGSPAIGMEVRAQAFAFKTTDDINNMTFYNFQIINRSSTVLNQTYMTVWTDADLGYFSDDYIGCDVKRGLGYIYNGDQDDETAAGINGYGKFLPALGCDFFQGPINTTDGIDNDGDGLTDELGEQMGMTKFLYFNNNISGTPAQTTDPDNAQQYYQYMTGFWKDGTPFTCGGNAYGGTTATSYVFPADTYTSGACGAATWDELSAGNLPNDRRFMQSAGPFTLQPGAVNYVTVGLPWAKTSIQGDNKASIALLKIADDKAQALFDKCFEVLSGPEAPDMTIQEMNNELIIYLTNKPSSNNYLNQYKELDPTIQILPGHYPDDKYYRLEGYKIYQMKNASAGQEDLDDGSKAKLVFQCDVENGFTRLVNFEYDNVTGGDVAKVRADNFGEQDDKGIRTTFHFTRDYFSSTSEQKVVNNKTYYFYCVAYGYNQYGQYKEDTPWANAGAASYEGQKIVYLEGRKSKRAYGIPHDPTPEKNGTISSSTYGYGPKITRHEGQGNGGNYLELTQQSIDDIVNSGSRKDELTYENGRGPIQVKVVDPLNVPNSSFSLDFLNANWHSNSDTVKSDPCHLSQYHIDNFPIKKLKTTNHLYGKVIADSTTWVLTDLGNGKLYKPCKSIKVGEEFYFSELGLSLNIGQVGDVADINNPVNTSTDKITKESDFIGANMYFSNSSQNWLTGLPDLDGETPYNWIRAGIYKQNITAANANYNDYSANNDPTSAVGNDVFADPDQVFENVLGGTWAPYCLTAPTRVVANNGAGTTYAAPAFSTVVSTSVSTTETRAAIMPNHDLRNLSGVDIVFTKDKSKWTHSLVLEECDEPGLTPGNAKKLEPRRHYSVDKQGIAIGSPGCNTTEALLDTFQTGLGWFPGYAVNVETGERLNIAFGEDSYQASNNGDDMLWNPTNQRTSTSYEYAFGGRHYIYVFGNSRGSSKYTGFAPAPIKGKMIGVGNYSNLTDFVHIYKYEFAKLSGTANEKITASIVLTNTWADAMWVNIPMTSQASFNFKKQEDMPCDARVSLRVKKAYRPGMASNIYISDAAGNNYNQAGFINPGTPISTDRYAPTNFLMYPTNAQSANVQRTIDTLTNSSNNSYGYYTFNTSDIFTEYNNADKAKSALDLINVVPNPYYGYSTYEKKRDQNAIRITNLPNKCKIRVYTLNGTLIRTFNRDVSGQEDILLKDDGANNYMKRLSYQEWDLKNQSGISIASGLYIIHIDVPEVGEKILKWFGVMRPLDLQNY